jgi:hypothetical protein
VVAVADSTAVAVVTAAVVDTAKST